MFTGRITVERVWRSAGLPAFALIGLLILGGCPQQEQQDTPSDLAVELPGQETPAESPEQAGLFTTPEAGQWPPDFPRYEGAEIQSYEPNSGDETAGFTMQFITPDNGEQVVEFYREYAAAEGYAETEAVTASDSGAAYFEREDSQLTLGYNAVPEGTTITVMVVPVQLTPEPVAPTGSGRLPDNFPSDILKVYPGAMILNAENMPMDNLLDQHISNATKKEVVEFFKAHFAELGFEIKRHEDKQNYAEYLFEKAGFGGVVFVLNMEPDNSISLHQMLGRL